MRSNTYFGPGQQCNYDASGQLITSGLGAGTPDRESPSFINFLYTSHYATDVDTYFMAGKLDGIDVTTGQLGPNLRKYLEVRPPDQGGGSCYRQFTFSF